MNRRDLTRGLGAAALLSTVGTVVHAQGGPVEGRDYQKLDKAMPIAGGKVEVVEFFAYWCPHCFAFESALDAWARKLPADKVAFRRVSIAFRPASEEQLQRLFYALEALGLVDSLHHKVFQAIHVSKTLPHGAKEADIAAFLKANGADAAKVLGTMKGFAVATKLRQTRQAMDGYGLDGVPMLGIQGQFRTSPSIAGSPERALAVADALIAKVRKG